MVSCALIGREILVSQLFDSRSIYLLSISHIHWIFTPALKYFQQLGKCFSDYFSWLYNFSLNSQPFMQKLLVMIISQTKYTQCAKTLRPKMWWRSIRSNWILNGSKWHTCVSNYVFQNLLNWHMWSGLSPWNYLKFSNAENAILVGVSYAFPFKLLR